MNKLTTALLAIVAATSFGQAQAADDFNVNEARSTRPYPTAYNCRISGSMSGGSIAIFIGGEVLEGPGVVTCSSSSGEVSRMPVTLKLVGGGVGFDFTRVDSIRVLTTGVGVNRPSDLYRSFAIGAQADVNLFNQGAGVGAAFRVSDDAGLSFELGLQGRDVEGLGAHLYGTAFSIEPRHGYRR